MSHRVQSYLEIERKLRTALESAESDYREACKISKTHLEEYVGSQLPSQDGTVFLKEISQPRKAAMERYAQALKEFTAFTLRREMPNGSDQPDQAVSSECPQRRPEASERPQ
jgi:hypothetical protein